MSALKFAAIAIMGMSLAACAGEPDAGRGPKEGTGTLLGAGTGALLGAAVAGAARAIVWRVPRSAACLAV